MGERSAEGPANFAHGLLSGLCHRHRKNSENDHFSWIVRNVAENHRFIEKRRARDRGQKVVLGCEVRFFAFGGPNMHGHLVERVRFQRQPHKPFHVDKHRPLRIVPREGGGVVAIGSSCSSWPSTQGWTASPKTSSCRTTYFECASGQGALKTQLRRYHVACGTDRRRKSACINSGGVSTKLFHSSDRIALSLLSDSLAGTNHSTEMLSQKRTFFSPGMRCRSSNAECADRSYGTFQHATLPSDSHDVPPRFRSFWREVSSIFSSSRSSFARKCQP